MTRDELAQLIGESLTRRLSSGQFWIVSPPGVMVRKLAAAVAADIEGKVCNVDHDSGGA